MIVLTLVTTAGSIFPSYGHPQTQETYPRTLMFASLAAFITASNLSRLSSMLQLIFFLLKDSDAAPNIATSFAPASSFLNINLKF